jgi:hypothetical protein
MKFFTLAWWCGLQEGDVTKEAFANEPRIGDLLS